jgi:hypothetical protein
MRDTHPAHLTELQQLTLFSGAKTAHEALLQNLGAHLEFRFALDDAEVQSGLAKINVAYDVARCKAVGNSFRISAK